MNGSAKDLFTLAYSEYIKLPKATLNGENKNAEIYSKRWCVHTGKSCCHPNPHRHYTFIEFIFNCGVKRDLYDRFVEALK